MRQVVLFMYTSLDGFVAGPNGEFDSYEPSEEEHRLANDVFGGATALMFGRVCYEGFIDYWDSLDLTAPTTPRVEAEFATLFRAKPLLVASRTLTTVVSRATLMADDVCGRVADWKQEGDGYLVLVCGPALLGTLMEKDLVEELRLVVKPVVQGRGLALFRDLSERTRLRLLATHAFASGAVLHHYSSTSRLSPSLA